MNTAWACWDLGLQEPTIYLLFHTCLARSCTQNRQTLDIGDCAKHGISEALLSVHTSLETERSNDTDLLRLPKT
jgi:hypothetical protein